MPLARPAPRTPFHIRNVECRGFRRADGLWDIEGHLTDVKSYDFINSWRGELVAGTPVHDMWLRLTVDVNFLIHAVEAVTDASPYRICGNITPNYQRLVGLTIGPGFTKKARAVLGGVQGCTHLLELLGPMATTCYQTVTRPTYIEEGIPADGGDDTRKRRTMVNTCHALASDSEVIQKFWPDLYTGNDKKLP